MTETAPRSPKPLLIKLGVVAAVLGVGAIFVARGYDIKGLMQRGLDLIRDAGPFVFFGAQAILPAVGAPISAFALTAGSAFGPQLGMPLVVTLSLLTLTINMVLTYWLAAHLLRPVLERLFTRLGYKLPEAESGNATDLIVLFRVTPGVPLPVQNYLLGLARVPFGKYLLVSCLIALPLNAAVVMFGEALLQGKGRIALIAFSLILMLMAVTQLVRKHYGKKRA